MATTKALRSIQVRLFLRRSRWGLIVMLIWFSFGTLGNIYWEDLSRFQSLMGALYLGIPDTPKSHFSEIYSFWGQCVLFGIVISIFFLQALQQYNPQEACRMLAREMKNHAIVIGYSHLGIRIVDQLRKEGWLYVVIEKDLMTVDDLVRSGEAVIVDNAKEIGTLEEAGVRQASLLVVASNNLETAMLVTKRARERNKTVKIIVRCYQDEFAEILEGLGADEVISSSKSAFRELCGHLDADLIHKQPS